MAISEYKLDSIIKEYEKEDPSDDDDDDLGQQTTFHLSPAMVLPFIIKRRHQTYVYII